MTVTTAEIIELLRTRSCPADASHVGPDWREDHGHADCRARTASSISSKTHVEGEAMTTPSAKVASAWVRVMRVTLPRHLMRAAK
jgi:hypothetical protein